MVWVASAGQGAYLATGVWWKGCLVGRGPARWLVVGCSTQTPPTRGVGYAAAIHHVALLRRLQ